ncbi:hypothetical protein [Bradyrhizobium acaciae]|uniref:hypothetical protein n=1 Tax=Bradyrhizobium acaciae TaxID=2683706 RepID=UPI001E362CAF|nr:hypothetical protein [Bradyrhizobium acaciae]MCC8979299.1 hypothetical protein [Bradyrhizobium acaciae]
MDGWLKTAKARLAECRTTISDQGLEGGLGDAVRNIVAEATYETYAPTIDAERTLSDRCSCRSSMDRIGFGLTQLSSGHRQSDASCR